MKPIRLSGHARERMEARGATQDEVAEAIRAAPWESAGGARLECRKNFAYDRKWNGNVYSTKQVRPIFVNEPYEILVVTVYVYYF